MSNWYIGQRIVAIRDHSQKVFKRGDEFTIKGLQTPECKCKGVEIDIGHKHNYDSNRYDFICPYCIHRYPITSFIWWFDEVMFAPLDEMEQAISELMESVNVVPAS